jgi:hypothetical protein
MMTRRNIVKRNALAKLTRRRFLYGSSGAALALPLLHTAGGSLQAQVGPVPERFVGLFVAQGIHGSITQDFLDFEDMGVAPLASLKPLEDRLTMVREINCLARSAQFKTPHTHGCASFLCGADAPARTTKGTATLDWVVNEHFQNNTALRTLNTGVWGGDDADERMRMVHSWRGVEQPNEPEESTLQVFENIFGDTPANPNPEDNTQALIAAEYRKSLLDAVLQDYQHAVSDASGYSPAVKRLITNHMETVRDLEIRAVAVAESLKNGGAMGCRVPTKPPHIEGNNQMDESKWQPIWDVMVDLFVHAYRCDIVRSGTFMVDSGGDKWSYQSERFGYTDNIHGGTLHNWKQDDNRGMALEIWQWYYDKVGDFLSRFADPSFADVDGGNLLDNTTIVVGTELADPDHDLDGMTYLIAGAKKRFNQGVHNFPGRTDADFYNTVLTGLGIEQRIGTQEGGSIKNYQGDLSFIA